MQTTKYLIILAYFLSLLSVSCNADREPAGKVIEHPVPNLIAYHAHDHILIKKKSTFEEVKDPNDQLILLKKYLKEPDQLQFEELDVMVHDASSVKIEAVDDARILILDTRDDQLIEYNLSDGTKNQVAGFGRGPRELQHSIDLERAGDFYYVARRDMRLSSFECDSQRCKYDNTIVLKIQPLSIASVNNKSLAIASGVVMNREDYIEQDIYIDFSPIKLINLEDGQILKEFGKIYNTKHMTVLERFSRTGIIEYISDIERYAYVSNWFPYIYIYNEDLEFEESYKIENHIQNKFEFYPDEQRRRFPDRNHTLISDLKVLKDGRILLITTTQNNKREKNNGNVEYDYTYDYYVIDHLNRNAFLLGTVSETAEYKKLVIPIQNTLIKNEGGVLYRLINK